ncbi:MAG TPA: alpha/beta hydrolase [Phycisphaerae bacterium]|nr:alpha/beta hydrolase [Phycisphaerae bacterium]HOQ84119.1 alpha/beta hydrolase [Phycisphaerae bacterium]HPP24991.1 alpha/beta hydrolase [Phycisphaerae bacterium]HPU24753.1 alpha/beta hydrolase [Phycisphaerae bacterium]HQA00746.1 alpha/beta hydrolase [Phycisphaerae bacterium]
MEQVICLHGLGRTRHCWWLLRRRLERAGYRTKAWTYPSFGVPIERLARDCRERLEACHADPAVRRVHVVTHSLGGIIVRTVLSELAVVPTNPGGQAGDRPREEDAGESFLDKLGTVVMLAPPNRGSAWARRLGALLRPLVPALPQLSDAPDSFVNRLPACPPGVCVAVIAAARDGKCPLATTHLPGQAAHIVVPGRHTFIMYRRDVAEAILQLLGEFSTSIIDEIYET